MRKFAIAALTIAFTTVAARANTVASYDYGSFSVSSFDSPIDVLAVNLGIGPDFGGADDPDAIHLFNKTFTNTASGNFTYTVDNTASNWNSVFSLLNDGTNRYISPVATVASAGTGESMNIAQFSDGFDPFIFSSASQVATVKSIELDLTDLQFTQQDFEGDTFYIASFNAAVVFSDQPATAAAPIPAAFPAGAVLLGGIAAASYFRRRRLA